MTQYTWSKIKMVEHSQERSLFTVFFFRLMGNSSIFSSPSSDTYSYSSLTGLLLSSFRVCNDPKPLGGFIVLDLQRNITGQSLIDVRLRVRNPGGSNRGRAPSSLEVSTPHSSHAFNTYPSIFFWDIVKLNLSLLADRGVLSNLHSSSILSRESGLLFCEVREEIVSNNLKKEKP